MSIENRLLYDMIHCMESIFCKPNLEGRSLVKADKRNENEG